jgi:hypothetical protein
MANAQNIFIDSINEIVDQRALELESSLAAEVISYYGPIHPALFKTFRNFVEKVAIKRHQRLAIVLHTGGGAVETVEKMATLIRSHFSEIYFVVPDFAMSAGTIFCMCGDKIYMDNTSSLGPIDPQVMVNNEYVPALGYLDKVKELVEKSQNGTLTDAEFLILQGQDLARLRRFEQARDLSVDLLKTWLVNYKFKNWNHHRSDPQKNGHEVTGAEKIERATEIAEKLGDNKIWHSHARMISIEKLRKELKLEIEDYTALVELKKNIRGYHDLLTDWIERQGMQFYLHHATERM